MINKITPLFTYVSSFFSRSSANDVPFIDHHSAVTECQPREKSTEQIDKDAYHVHISAKNAPNPIISIVKGAALILVNLASSLASNNTTEFVTTNSTNITENALSDINNSSSIDFSFSNQLFVSNNTNDHNMIINHTMGEDKHDSRLNTALIVAPLVAMPIVIIMLVAYCKPSILNGYKFLRETIASNEQEIKDLLPTPESALDSNHIGSVETLTSIIEDEDDSIKRGFSVEF